MDFGCEYLPYELTRRYSSLVIDYLHQEPFLKSFYEHSFDRDGLQKAMDQRKNFQSPRELLVEQLTQQYHEIDAHRLVSENISRLADPHTFTICTAHQPNIFTGPLYVIYKIMHTISLSHYCSQMFPGCHFVPVYYMGSEDADLDELGHIFIRGEKIKWNTSQTGAVGRMKVDKAFLSLIDRLGGELGVLPFGPDLHQIFRDAYQEGRSIQESTLILMNSLFGAYGLVVLIPDNKALKQYFSPVVKRELLEQFSHPLVKQTGDALGSRYKVQASGREVNLFYLVDDRRERLDFHDGLYKVEALGLTFTKEEVLAELENSPERFSANVILRPVFQETILPNIAFVGGGGELAYWMELKRVFQSCEVPYPVLVLRNSFMQLDHHHIDVLKHSRLQWDSFFDDASAMMRKVVDLNAEQQVDISSEVQSLQQGYIQLAQLAGEVDQSLQNHTLALAAQAANKLKRLQRKLYNREKKKMGDLIRKIERMRSDLLPGEGLQERQENFSVYYAKYGPEWFQTIYEASPDVDPKFTLMMLPKIS